MPRPAYECELEGDAGRRRWQKEELLCDKGRRLVVDVQLSADRQSRVELRRKSGAAKEDHQYDGYRGAVAALATAAQRAVAIRRR